MYEKIKALISRNDLTTAERVLDKHCEGLSPAQSAELRSLLAKQRRRRYAEFRKERKRLRRRGHWRAVWALKRGIVTCWSVLGIVLFPYVKIHYLAARQGLTVQRRLSMELVFLLGLVLGILFCGLGFSEVRRSRKANQEAKGRAARADCPDWETIGQFQCLEAFGRKEERGWLIALLCVTAAVLYQLWSIYRIFFK